MPLTTVDRLYLTRAYELAARGIGNVSPNPPVGAVIVRDGQTLGEGFHHQRGLAHAEVEAFRMAAAAGYTADDLANATLYVSLEPCNHHGRTPACSQAVIASGIRRIVIGTVDPNPQTSLGGISALQDVGISVDLANDPVAAALIEPFRNAICSKRPFVTLKMAASLDGRIAPRRERYWLTGEPARKWVRDLRAAHDMVLVGAATARIDNPRLLPQPPCSRRRPRLRGVICGTTPPPMDLQIFHATPQDVAKTWLIVPQHAEAAYDAHRALAEILPVAADESGRVQLGAALDALHEREVGSVLCEGGPTLAGALLAGGYVDRLEWLIAPKLFIASEAINVLQGELVDLQIAWDVIERLGDDLRCSARPSSSVR